MKKILKIILSIIVFLSLYSCIEEYWPDIDKIERLLVGDALITDNPGPYYVTLSYSAIPQNPEYLPVSNASVFISDDKYTTFSGCREHS